MEIEVKIKNKLEVGDFFRNSSRDDLEGPDVGYVIEIVGSTKTKYSGPKIIYKVYWLKEKRLTSYHLTLHSAEYTIILNRKNHD
jgi:hypothetical protein